MSDNREVGTEIHDKPQKCMVRIVLRSQSSLLIERVVPYAGNPEITIAPMVYLDSAVHAVNSLGGRAAGELLPGGRIILAGEVEVHPYFAKAGSRLEWAVRTTPRDMSVAIVSIAINGHSLYSEG